VAVLFEGRFKASEMEGAEENKVCKTIEISS